MNNKQFLIIGDNLAIDFINTQIVEDGKPKDLLTNFEDFVLWQKALGLIDQSEVERLNKKWSRYDVQKAFRDVLNFRKILRETVESLSDVKPIKSSALQKLNEILRQKYGYYQVVKTKNKFEKKFHAEIEQPRQLLLPIAESGADLLSSGNLKNIRKCENSACILYFYDITKNHKRRWCSMTACGNRAKAAAFYQRQRQKRRKR
jgi:predicted RNA-binding Zn ribbon-like protein